MADAEFRESILNALQAANAAELTADAGIGIAVAGVLALIHLADVLEAKDATAGPTPGEDEVRLDKRPARPAPLTRKQRRCPSQGSVKGRTWSGAKEETTFIVGCQLPEHGVDEAHVFHVEWGGRNG